jgi:hypothetical protein
MHLVKKRLSKSWVSGQKERYNATDDDTRNLAMSIHHKILFDVHTTVLWGDPIKPLAATEHGLPPRAENTVIKSSAPPGSKTRSR